ncbi:MAG: BglII/BstYI family type II restriction endonuclease [Blastocatellia bacterium]
MPISAFTRHLRENFEIHEWRHATAILERDFPAEYNEICSVLTRFQLHKHYIDTGGGRKSPVSGWIDSEFYKFGWREKKFDTKITVDERDRESPTHSVDCFKNGIALEIEWNNKDPFFDRDLNNFRLLFDLHVISVGVIVTRCDGLQNIFNSLGRGSSFGASTTHMSKLLPRIQGGGGGGCPLLVFGISEGLYVDSE